jgi:hypothetical protein
MMLLLLDGFLDKTDDTRLEPASGVLVVVVVVASNVVVDVAVRLVLLLGVRRVTGAVAATTSSKARFLLGGKDIFSRQMCSSLLGEYYYIE